MDIERIEFVRGLKGAPASIVLALVFCGGSMTNSEIEQMTGYSDKPISKGLALLELKGLVQNNGLQYGWSLTAGVQQLPLFPSSMLNSGESRNISDFVPMSRKLSDSYTTTTTTDPILEKEEVVVSKNGHTSRKFSDSGVESWLIRGGVGKNSPKMRQLLRHEFDEAYVQAHVLERLAVISRPEGHWYHTGLLIRKLMDGDQAPPMRCPDCLEYVAHCNCGRRCQTCGDAAAQLYQGECLFCAGIIER